MPGMDLKKWAGAKAAPGGPAKGPIPPPGPPGPKGPPGPPGAGPGPAQGAPANVIASVPSSALPPDQAQWAMAGGNDLDRPDSPPPWVEDQQAWDMAVRAVQKNWEAHEDPWATVIALANQLS